MSVVTASNRANLTAWLAPQIPVRPVPTPAPCATAQTTAVDRARESALSPHVRPRRKRFPNDPIFLLPRPDAVAPPRTDRKPLSCSRDNFEILAIRHMFALMNSW